MEELVSQLGLNFDDTFSITNYLINIVICSLLLFVLAFVYIRFGKSISNRAQLSKVLIVVGLTTFVIISIVKSSLALSLGLVGALSIVRFRTAIKEPEELGFFFIAIALGLGMGAGQLLPTLIGFAVLSLVIIIMSKRNIKTVITQNLLISLPTISEEKTKRTQEISDLVMSKANQVDLKRMQYTSDTIHLNFLVTMGSINSLTEMNDALLQIDNNMDITFIDNQV
jgi:uncharacterized membrane protein YhiD involved in acid resistance